MEEAIADVLRGQRELALEKFNSISADNSDYAEVWNRIATCEFMLGNKSRSLEAAKKTIELMPWYFQAYAGKGICEYEQEKYTEAEASFRKSLELSPWSLISSKLAECVDVINRLAQSETDTKNTDEK